jgi:uncharacterized membrane protein YbaN (DUF454 family)
VLTETTPPEPKPTAVADPGLPLLPGPLRAALLVAGFACVGLAALGVFLPLLPTTPFLLVAAACFARSSPRFYRALLGNRIFGPLIRDWREHRAVPLRAKILAITAITLVLGSTILFSVAIPAVQIGLAAFGAGLCIWLWRLPTRAPDADGSTQTP